MDVPGVLSRSATPSLGRSTLSLSWLKKTMDATVAFSCKSPNVGIVRPGCTCFRLSWCGQDYVLSASHCFPPSETQVEAVFPPQDESGAPFGTVLDLLFRNDTADVCVFFPRVPFPRKTAPLLLAQSTVADAPPGSPVILMGYGLLLDPNSCEKGTVRETGWIHPDAGAGCPQILFSGSLFGGYSGSPVVSLRTGSVVGIHTATRGDSTGYNQGPQSEVIFWCLQASRRSLTRTPFPVFPATVDQTLNPAALWVRTGKTWGLVVSASDDPAFLPGDLVLTVRGKKVGALAGEKGSHNHPGSGLLGFSAGDRMAAVIIRPRQGPSADPVLKYREPFSQYPLFEEVPSFYGGVVVQPTGWGKGGGVGGAIPPNAIAWPRYLPDDISLLGDISRFSVLIYPQESVDIKVYGARSDTPSQNDYVTSLQITTAQGDNSSTLLASGTSGDPVSATIAPPPPGTPNTEIFFEVTITRQEGSAMFVILSGWGDRRDFEVPFDIARWWDVTVLTPPTNGALMDEYELYGTEPTLDYDRPPREVEFAIRGADSFLPVLMASASVHGRPRK